MILKIHTRRMNLKDVNLKEFAKRTEKFSGAHLKALCTEAGMKAIRERKTSITQKHFEMAIVEIMDKDHTSVKQFIYS